MGAEPTGLCRSCPYDRGAIPPSVGFDVVASSTWLPNGIYTLNAQEEQLAYTGNGLYGFDTVVLGTDDGARNLSHQVFASVADKSYFLGQFGIGPKPINFTTFNEPIPNYLSTLVNFSMVPSLSFGYTAGAAYRNKTSASLTLGGYDSNRFSPTNLSIAMNFDNSRPLQIGLQRVQATGTATGDVDLLPEGTFLFVDSTIPHIWLPQDAVDAFVSTFGLTYDSNTDLFLINDTMRERNLQAMPNLHFSFGASLSGGPTQTISLPYSAFDLQASYPFYENATNYFPIRLAHNDTQYTIGRTFFQEAYVIAGWEWQNFTIAQTSFDNLNNEHLITITSRTQDTAATTRKTAASTKGLSKGAIAGIAIGALLLALATSSLLFSAFESDADNEQGRSLQMSDQTVLLTVSLPPMTMKSSPCCLLQSPSCHLTTPSTNCLPLRIRSRLTGSRWRHPRSIMSYPQAPTTVPAV
ncbi:hypothetical protein LTR95_011469 [Oleoguttula sp. CCFEE 5521]